MDCDHGVRSVRPKLGHLLSAWILAAIRGVTALFACSLLNGSCFAAEPSTPAYLFATPDYAAVLGFDLSNEQAPVATVLINHGLGIPSAAVDLYLPFKVKQASSNEEALFRIGTFDRWTLVTYTDDPATRWPQQVSFFPVSDVMSEPPPQNTELRGSLYLQNQGQVWRFLYRYPDPRSSNTLPSNSSRLPFRRFDAIAVALPRNATRLEVRGKSAMPEHLTENAYARFYPPTPASQSEPFLDVEYILPPTPWQKLVLKYAAKIAGALAPLIGIVLAYLARRRPRLRLAFIALTVIVYIGLLIVVVGFASSIGETGSDLIADFILLGISGAVALVSSRLKIEEEGAPTIRLATPEPPSRPPAIAAPSSSRR